MRLMTLMANNIMTLEYISTCPTGHMVLFYFRFIQPVVSLWQSPFFIILYTSSHICLSILMTLPEE